MRELLSLPIDEIRFEDVVKFCSHQTPENERLEYKETFSPKSPAKQVAKELSAFANTQGGILIYGVADVGERRPESNPEGRDLGNDPGATVLNACTHSVDPPLVPEVSDSLPNPGDRKRGFLVVRVSASEEIHTVETRADVYVRVRDQSQPVPATVEQVERLLARRARAVSAQTERRRKAHLRLMVPLSQTPQKGQVSLSIGPWLNDDPLLSVRDLPALVSEVSVLSSAYCDKFPLAPSETVGVVHDGIYTSDRRGTVACLVDVFGNLTMVSRLASHVRFDRRFDQEDGRYFPRDGEAYLGLSASYVLELVLCLLRVAQQFFARVKYVGLVGVRFDADHIRNVPFCLINSYGEASLVGSSKIDDQIVIEDVLSTSELGADAIQYFSHLCDRVVWAWGRSDRDCVDAVVEDVECEHWGSDTCPECHNRKKPKRRSACWSCRKKAEKP